MIMNTNWLVFAYSDSWWKEWSNQKPWKKESEIMFARRHPSLRTSGAQTTSHFFVCSTVSRQDKSTASRALLQPSACQLSATRPPKKKKTQPFLVEAPE